MAEFQSAPEGEYPPDEPGVDPERAPAVVEAALRRGVSRRGVLIGAGVGALSLGAVGTGLGIALTRPGTAAGATPSDAAKIAHLLRRAGFGPTPSELPTYLALGVHGAVERVLTYTSQPDDVESTLAGQTFDFTKPQDLMRWSLLRMLYSKRPLEEKMTLFWHGVLTSSFRKLGKKDNYPLLRQQADLLRTHATGRFDDLIRAISVDPAMLWWLDGRVSTGRSPNENYARELMELFTMGIGNYTQNDVSQGALALSGWVIQNGAGKLVPARHYTGTVTFLGQTGKLGLDDVVKLVCAHPSTGPYLARRLWSFFVSDAPSESDLAPVAAAYTASNHSIAAMLRALFTSPAFFATATYRARIKSPAEFVVGAVRGLGVATDAKTLPQVVSAMGQTLFAPPDVSGWAGDKLSSAWLTTQTWMARVNFINALAVAATTSGAGGASAVERAITTHSLRTSADLVRYFSTALLDAPLSAERAAILTQALTASATPAGPMLTLAGGAKLPAAGVRQALYLLLSSPEYHLN